jgi:hypothetical protein
MQCFNPAYTTSAKISFSAFPDVEYSSQGFVFPGIEAIYPVIVTPHLALPMSPGAIRYEPLNVTFLVDSKLVNYASIVKWLQTAPTTASKATFSSAHVFLLDADKQVASRVRFDDVMPTGISSINYQFNVNEPQIITATATFAFTQFTFE